MDTHERVAGVILAGGRSSRMGGTDKALLPLAGETLLARAIARLAPQVSHIVISANGELNRFAQYALPVVADRAPDYPGPLAGILAGLEWVAANRPDIRRVVSVPTDTPFFPVDLVDRFLAEPPRIPTLFVARSQSGVHPVVGMWTVEIAPELAKALAEGKRKVGDWTRQQKAVEVVFPAAVIGGREVDPLFNINRPEDLAEAEALLKTR